MTGAVAAASFVAHDRAFADVVGDEPRLLRVVETDAHEGPVYVAEEDALYFTSVPGPGVAIKRLALASGAVSVVRADANAANGMALGRDGRLVVCEQGGSDEPARISVVDRATGEAETVVDAWGGQPLNSPNDVVVKRDGTIWFTDPTYGFLQGFKPTAGELLGEIRVPGAVNFAWGGPGRDVLYITADSAVWAAVLQAHDNRPEEA